MRKVLRVYGIRISWSVGPVRFEEYTHPKMGVYIESLQINQVLYINNNSFVSLSSYVYEFQIIITSPVKSDSKQLISSQIG